MVQIRKKTGLVQEFNANKIITSIIKSAERVHIDIPPTKTNKVVDLVLEKIRDCEVVDVRELHSLIVTALEEVDLSVAQSYCEYSTLSSNQKFSLSEESTEEQFVKNKIAFINKYKQSSNTANSTIDDNSNVSNKNVAILNAEIHKPENIRISRSMVMGKLKELYPDFNAKRYIRDLEDHVIYKHDESSIAGICPYCVSITMYPFLLDGIKGLGGLSASPKNLKSFCGIFCNMVFAISSQFAGALAASETMLYFTYYCKKEWGPDFYLYSDKVVETNYEGKQRTILDEIHQYWQQIIYTINQPAAARGFQSAFVNFSYFDKPFFDGMFGDFCFPDGTQPDWESLKWIQMEFMKWFNAERLKTVLTFPVETVTLLYKDGKFLDEEMAQFVYDEYSRGHSFFTYISDTVDSLSSCCFSKNQKVLWKSSTKGVQLTTFEELHNIKWEPYKKNLKIFHNGSWVSGKSIKLNNRKMFKVITYNNKELIVTDNHINVTLDGDKPTSELTTNDYLMFNNIPLQAIPENDEYLTYEQGFVIGAFLGDGSFGSEINNTIYDINFSLSINKYKKTMEMIDIANSQIGGCNSCSLSTIYNNVYPVRILSKELVAFIQRWTLWERGTYAYNKKLNLDCLLQSFSFRKGILDGWYHTDGGNSNRCYTTSKELAEDMEVLLTSLGLQSMINISDRTDEEVIIRDDHSKHNYPLYCVRWYSQTNIRSNKDENKSWVKRNNSIYFKIKSIEKVDYTEDVYCIQCKNQEEPYFTLPNGIITHNCRLKNKLQTKEFNFTSGNIGIQTGSKSVITFNLNRLVQLWYRKEMEKREDSFKFDSSCYPSLKKYLVKLMDRVYKYHHAYNELLWDMYDADLLPAYKAGFIHLNKQYLTLGINGLNQAAEFLGMECSVNDNYAKFCQEIFSLFKEQNELHKDTTSKHHLIFNTEQVPAESLGAKNYNWDKEDGYWVDKDSNLYASYIFKPNNPSLSVLDKIKMHGRDYIGEYLDGGSACHINLDSHLSSEQYKLLLNYAAENGCNYLTFNIPMTECRECGNIVNAPVDKCPKCGCDKMQYYTRIIGYLTAVKNWNSNRQKEFETRMFGDKGNYKTYKAK